MKKFAFIFTIALGLLTTSCDDYMDINHNPNSPAEENMTTNILFPGAEMNLCSSYGDFYRITGGYFAQYYSQAFGTSNYLDYSKFSMSATRSSTDYTQLNQRALKNLKTAAELAEASEEWGTFLAAKTLKAFIYQVLVDAYGEVPYTEALDPSNATPKYDQGADIYAGVLAELDEALSKASEGDQVATNFLLPGKTAGEWIKLANAVKLKMLTRESGVADVNSQIAALVSQNNFPEGDVAWEGCWSNESGALSPFFAEEFSTAWGSTQINCIGNVAIIGTMNQTSYVDGRLAAFFEPNSDGNFTGGISGSNFSTSSKYKSSYWCRPVASYDMPVYFITKAEIEFFIAEYYAKAGNANQAKAHYEAAIEASFETAGVPGAAEAIKQFPYDQTNYKKCIGVSKWIALAGVNTFEGWCEARRLDFPAFGSVQGSQMYNEQSDASYHPELYVPGTFYTPIKVEDKLGANKILERWPYPESSSARNSNCPDFPGYASPVFWGK